MTGSLSRNAWPVTVTVLPLVVVGDGKNLGHRSALVTDLEGVHGVKDLEAIREMDEPQKITINKLGEDSLHDRLQTHNQSVSESEAPH